MRRSLLFVLALVSLPALADTPAPLASARNQCPWTGPAPEARIVRDAATWSALAGGDTDPGFASPVDWQRESLLVLAPGARPTPGYRLELLATRWQRSAGRWSFRLGETPPPADAMLPQVISHPCLILRVPRAGLRALQLSDARGRPLASAR